MTDDIVKASPIQYYLDLDDGGVNLSVLEDLDVDPSWQNAGEKIATLMGLQNDAQWAIGEILMFIRYRAMYGTVAEFKWDGGEWPDELFTFIRDHFGHSLNAQDAELVEFLMWNSYRYEKFWILVPLVGRGVIKVWQRSKGARELGEDEWETFVRRLGGALSEIMDGGTLLSYYYTAACFPRSMRILTVSWTAHYEVTNLAGSEIDPTLRGTQRLEAKAPIAQSTLQEMIQTGRVTTSRVRAHQRKNASRTRGYEWLLPPVQCLYVRDTNNGGLYIALEFELEVETEEAIKAILYAAGLTTTYARVDGMIWSGDVERPTLSLSNGELVATCPEPNEPAVANAISALGNKMKWKVEE